ncbi:hypothetical protein H6G81_28030 [Scytonema hofmannii FACHB-248]|uniref:Uncharacterized protein n=1 Tax=Scytonema hofmannii FACHB-248 TaxID=1842502 RepID=A0ABR8GYN8_9CYAN|nr:MULTISPECIES: hypothetical protein [Nostocales]MBD2608259.1 hypothetical protein [Scytonema hofmannii FACHB-248]
MKPFAIALQIFILSVHAIALGCDRFKTGDVYDGIRLRTPNIHTLASCDRASVVIGLKQVIA